ncbi:MAG: DUF5668 domain-containing protein [Rhizobacter sp.]|nr:DUF5668 domain-containing protein [Rhizobacter sp.]
MKTSGIILIVLGCLFLAGNLGWLHWSALQKWWPLILIAVGIWSIVRPRHEVRRPDQDRDNES